MAVLDRLGYGIVIVPKAAARAVPAAWGPTDPAVKTKVQIAVEKLNQKSPQECPLCSRKSECRIALPPAEQ